MHECVDCAFVFTSDPPLNMTSPDSLTDGNNSTELGGRISESRKKGIRKKHPPAEYLSRTYL